MELIFVAGCSVLMKSQGQVTLAHALDFLIFLKPGPGGADDILCLIDKFKELQAIELKLIRHIDLALHRSDRGSPCDRYHGLCRRQWDQIMWEGLDLLEEIV
jgi:hypothetical protein